MSSLQPTPEQRRLLATVRRDQPIQGIYALASRVERPYRRVFDDVRVLKAGDALTVEPGTLNGRRISTIRLSNQRATGALALILGQVNAPLRRKLTPQAFLKLLVTNQPVSRYGLAALISFFSDIEESLWTRFARESGLSASALHGIYRKRVQPILPSRRFERWFHATAG